MNNLEMALSYIKKSETRIRHARLAINEGDYSYVVRQCQEAVELLLKAALRLVGIEYPKRHDVGFVLKIEAKRFPKWFQQEIDSLAKISSELGSKRELSMYGDEEKGIPPDALFSKEDAEKALNFAEYVYALVSRLLESYAKG